MKASDFPHELPPGFPPESLGAFLNDTWAEIAPFAYRCYLQHGGGLVLWQWDNKVKLLKMLGYVGKEELIKNGFNKHCLARVNNYDPEEMVVIGIMWNVGHEDYMSWWFLAKNPGELTPKELYLKSQNRV